MIALEMEATAPVELALDAPETRLEDPVTEAMADEAEADAPDAEPALAEAEPLAELFNQPLFHSQVGDDSPSNECGGADGLTSSRASSGQLTENSVECTGLRGRHSRGIAQDALKTANKARVVAGLAYSETAGIVTSGTRLVDGDGRSALRLAGSRDLGGGDLPSEERRVLGACEEIRDLVGGCIVSEAPND